jgi:hypothetical protein
MSLENVIFPAPFRLANRNPLGLTPEKQARSISNFQLAVFESASRALKHLTPIIIPAGVEVLRNVPEPWCPDGFAARTIPVWASQSTKNRWSGTLVGTGISKGALYTALDVRALLNEAMRYRRTENEKKIAWQGSPSGEATYMTWGPTTSDYNKLLVDRIYYKFQLQRWIVVGDLTHAASGDFYRHIENDPAYQAAKKDLRLQVDLATIASDLVDYTGSRPLGLSLLLNPSFDGLQAQTAQSELPIVPGSGINVVLGGDDGKQVQVLRPVSKIIAGTSDGRPALLEVGLDGKRMDPVVVVPGSILPISTKS